MDYFSNPAFHLWSLCSEEKLHQSLTVTYFSILGASCSPLYLQSETMLSCHVCLLTLLCRRATVIPVSLECTFITKRWRLSGVTWQYLIYMYRNISVTFVFILSQGHPGLGVCPPGSFPGEELWDVHLTVGRPHGGAVTLCRAQCHPGQYRVKQYRVAQSQVSKGLSVLCPWNLPIKLLTGLTEDWHLRPLHWLLPAGP